MTEEVASPCISICTIDEDTGFCRGCYRTEAEVEKWIKYTNNEKRAVILALARRKKLLPDLGAR